MEGVRWAPTPSFAGMVAIVEQAQAQRPTHSADRISSVFVPAVLVIAALTAAGWLIAGDNPTVPSRPHSRACHRLPCVALRLATTAMMVALVAIAQLGIFLKGCKSLEATARWTPSSSTRPAP